MSPFAFVFPTLLGANHFLMSTRSPFYNAFNFAQKCEWLAWTNTVLFQSAFTSIYALGFPPIQELGFAYILYDTLFLPTYNRDPLMYVHHAFAIATSTFFAYANHVSAFMDAVIYLESSNILLGITWLLNRAGYGKTLLTKVVGACALLVYIMNRVILFPYHLAFVAPRVVAIPMAVFVPMNYFWSWKLVQYYAYIAFGMKVGH